MKLDWSKLTNYFYLSRKNFLEISWYLLSFFYVRIYLLIAVTINLLNWIFVYYFYTNLSQNLVILHYNINLGVNLIGDASRIFIIPVLGLIFIVLNYILLINVYRQGKLLCHFLLATTAVVNFLLLIGAATLYLINFR